MRPVITPFRAFVICQPLLAHSPGCYVYPQEGSRCLQTRLPYQKFTRLAQAPRRLKALNISTLETFQEGVRILHNQTRLFSWQHVDSNTLPGTAREQSALLLALV